MTVVVEPTQKQKWWADELVRESKERAVRTGKRSCLAGWSYDPRYPSGMTFLVAPSGERWIDFPEGLVR